GVCADGRGALYVGAGLAGIGRKGLADELAVRPHAYRSIVYAHDATTACLGAHGAREGGIVIVGTGSIGFAVVGGREVRVGGYGFPISHHATAPHPAPPPIP